MAKEMTFGHIQPDMTLSKAERDADKAAWKALDDEVKVLRGEHDAYVARIVELERKCVQWERWYEGIVADFVGLTTDRSDPDKLHDWEWMDDYRPAPTRIEIHMDFE